MSSIYEITQDYLTILEMMELPELDAQTLRDTMEGIDGEFEIKADGYAKVLKEIEASIEAIDKEKERLAERSKTLKENAKKLKATLQGAMETIGKTKFKTDLFSFGIQKNPVALVIDENDVKKFPRKYIKVERSIDKTALKEALKNGAEFEGLAHLEQSESLRIR